MSAKGSTPRGGSPDEKKTVSRHDIDVEAAAPHGWAQWFGGPKTTVGPRIGPVLDSITIAAEDSDDSASAILHRQKEAEQGADIQYRSCSWQMVGYLTRPLSLVVVCQRDADFRYDTRPPCCSFLNIFAW